LGVFLGVCFFFGMTPLGLRAVAVGSAGGGGARRPGASASAERPTQLRPRRTAGAGC
jgi:hypothetical protein